MITRQTLSIKPFMGLSLGKLTLLLVAAVLGLALMVTQGSTAFADNATSTSFVPTEVTLANDGDMATITITTIGADPTANGFQILIEHPSTLTVSDPECIGIFTGGSQTPATPQAGVGTLTGCALSPGPISPADGDMMTFVLNRVGAFTENQTVTIAPLGGPASTFFSLGGETIGGPGTTNTLTVQAAVAVPDVVGSTQADAETAIVAAGLVVGVVTEESSETVAAGSVISQDPVADTLVDPDSAVNLVVSIGPAPPSTEFSTETVTLGPDEPEIVTVATVNVDATAVAVLINMLHPDTLTVTSPECAGILSLGATERFEVVGGTIITCVLPDGVVDGTTGDVMSFTLTRVGDITTDETVSMVVDAADPFGTAFFDAADTPIPPGTTNTITVQAPVAVPDVVGLTQAAAETEIETAGLVVGVVTEESSETVPAGSVISQDPVADTLVDPGSAVNLVVSTGPEPVAVPNVVDLTQAAAEAQIVAAGLVVGAVTEGSSDTVAAGSVISQDPVAGTSVAPGSAVNLVVSTGPAPSTEFSPETVTLGPDEPEIVTVDTVNVDATANSVVISIQHPDTLTVTSPACAGIFSAGTAGPFEPDPDTGTGIFCQLLDGVAVTGTTGDVMSFTLTRVGDITADQTVSMLVDAADPLATGFFAVDATPIGPGTTNTITVQAAAVPGVTIVESDGTNVTEAGDTDSYTVVLDTAPTADVIITVTPDAQVTVDADPLTFTADNFDTPQIVTVSAVDDTEVEGDHTGTISHSAASDDADYQGISILDVDANIVDNDVGSADPITSTITADQESIVADGVSTSTITVQLKDADGTNLTSGGDTVELATDDLGSLGGVTDIGDGTYTATLTSETTAGTATVSGTLNTVGMTDTATVEFTPGLADPTTSTIVAVPEVILPDGTSTSTITVQLKDLNGNNLTSGEDTVELATDDLGSLGGVTDIGDGTYTATLTSGTTAGTATVSGTLNTVAMTDTATVEFNTPPVAVADSYTVAEGGTLTADDADGTGTPDSADDGVLVNDTDAEDDALTAVLDIDTNVANGVLDLAADGTFTYIHDDSENLTDSFTYHANDGINDSNIVTVDISITPVNDNAPVADAGPDQNVLQEDTVTLDGSGSSDADGDVPSFSWILTTRPEGSSATLSDVTAEFPTFEADLLGDYVATVIVSDGGELDSAPDSVTVHAVDQVITLRVPGQYAVLSAPTLLSDLPTFAQDDDSLDAFGSVLIYVDGEFIDASDSRFAVEIVKPVTAFYVNGSGTTTVGFNAAQIDSPAITSKELTSDWNLIGTNSRGLAEDELSQIQNTPTTAGMVTLHVPNSANGNKNTGQEPEDWETDGDRDLNANPIINLPERNLSAFDGYWVKMDAPRSYSKQLAETLETPQS